MEKERKFENKGLYYPYSDYLKEKYHEKVYKLPVNLPVSCPNRVDGPGCAFCAGAGTGFEAMDAQICVSEQILRTKERIEEKYHAHKFIAYFQNYTNTFLPLDDFKAVVLEAANFPDVVEISISTRPDCIRDEYLEFLNEVSAKYHICITIELGFQTANYHILYHILRCLLWMRLLYFIIFYHILR